MIIAWRLTAQFFGGTSPEHDSGSARKPRIPLTATEAERLSKRKRPCTMATPERSKSAGVSYRRTQISILLSRALNCVEFTCRSNAVSVSATFLIIGKQQCTKRNVSFSTGVNGTMGSAHVQRRPGVSAFVPGRSSAPAK